MTHLVWDWNGTLLDDFALVLNATNTCLASVGGRPVTAEEHRRGFRRPIAKYYEHVLGHPVGPDEFVALDTVFHDAYRAGLADCRLAVDALAAMAAWEGTQSLLSMYFHDELVVTVARLGLALNLSRVDGLRDTVGGGSKTPHLVAHLNVLGVRGDDCVLIGDSVDDAEAAVAVGAAIVLYSGGFTDEARLSAIGVPVAATLTEAVEFARAGARSPSRW